MLTNILSTDFAFIWQTDRRVAVVWKTVVTMCWKALRNWQVLAIDWHVRLSSCGTARVASLSSASHSSKLIDAISGNSVANARSILIIRSTVENSFGTATDTCTTRVIKRQTMAKCSCMATGKSPSPWAWEVNTTNELTYNNNMLFLRHFICHLIIPSIC